MRLKANADRRGKVSGRDVAQRSDEVKENITGLPTVSGYDMSAEM